MLASNNIMYIQCHANTISQSSSLLNSRWGSITQSRWVLVFFFFAIEVTCFIVCTILLKVRIFFLKVDHSTGSYKVFEFTWEVMFCTHVKISCYDFDVRQSSCWSTSVHNCELKCRGLYTAQRATHLCWKTLLFPKEISLGTSGLVILD